MLPLDMVCGSEGAGEKEEAPEVVGCKEGVAGALCPEDREDTSDWEGGVEGEVETEVDPEDHWEADPTLTTSRGKGACWSGHRGERSGDHGRGRRGKQGGCGC